MTSVVTDADAHVGARLAAIPKTSAGFTPAWVERALAEGGLPNRGIAAVDIARIGEGIGVLAELYRLRLTYKPGAAGPASVIAKLHSSRPEVREICAAYGMYEREMRFYRDVAPTIELRTPHHYFSAFDSASGDCVILMQDLAPAESPDQIAGIPLGMLTEAIDGVAALHARWWSDPRLDELSGVMPAAADPPYSSGADNYRAVLPLALEGLKALALHDLARVAEKLGRRVDGMIVALCAQPRTLVHGDFRTANLMFDQTPSGPELTVVDWQTVMQARGPFDVGYLMGGAVPTELRRANEMALLRRYHDRLTRLGVTGYGFDDCLLDYRRAVLFGLINWAEGYAMSDKDDPRAVALFESWAGRLAAAVEDLGLDALVD